MDGELMRPWVTTQSGLSCRGIVLPSPIVIEAGAIVEIAGVRGEAGGERSSQARDTGGGNELLAAMGHAPNRCTCSCKGCGSSQHCYDHRCFPLE